MGFWLQRSVILGGDLSLDLSGRSTYPSSPPPCAYPIPGTSLFYRDDIYVAGRTPRFAPSAPYLQMRPEVVASAGPDRPLANGIWALAVGDLDVARVDLERSAAHEGSAGASIRLFLALVAIAQERAADAVDLLRAVVASDQVLPDDVMRTQLVRGALDVHVTGNLSAHTDLDRGGAALLLAEMLQVDGRPNEAIDLLETMGWRTQQPALALALADLYVEQGMHAEVARVTGRFTANTSDLALQILLLRTRARREAGDLAVSLATCEEALRFPQRDPHLIRAAHYERALTLEARGQDGLAHRELELILEEDPGFRDVMVRLSSRPKGRAQGPA